MNSKAGSFKWERESSSHRSECVAVSGITRERFSVFTGTFDETRERRCGDVGNRWAGAPRGRLAPAVHLLSLSERVLVLSQAAAHGARGAAVLHEPAAADGACLTTHFTHERSERTDVLPVRTPSSLPHTRSCRYLDDLCGAL